MFKRLLIGCVTVVLLGAVFVAVSRAEDGPAAEPAAPAAEPPAAAAEQPEAEGEAADPPKNLKLPGIIVDMKQKIVDVDAKVVLREGMLELVACTANTKEHESIVVLQAKAQHIHLALLLLGAKPGRPTPWVQLEDNTLKRLLPEGDKVKMSFVFEEAGQEADVPVSRFIVNSKGKHTSGDVFLFAGSVLTKLDDGRMLYAADESGDVMSLVSFGDEMLVLPNPASNDYSTLDWYADTQNIPTEGTKLRVRLRLLDKDKKDDAAKDDDGPLMHDDFDEDTGG